VLELHLRAERLETRHLHEDVVVLRRHQLAVGRRAPLRPLLLRVVEPDVRAGHVRRHAQEGHEHALREVRLEVVDVPGADLDVRLADVVVAELVDHDVVAADGERQARRRHGGRDRLPPGVR